MKTVLFVACILGVTGLSAQTLTGTVSDDKNQVLKEAVVYWLGTTNHVRTNEKGEFEILKSELTTLLIAKYDGFDSDTLDVNGQTSVRFSLVQSQALEEVVVSGQLEGVIISDQKAIKTEQITQAELVKSACCDLAGCFETQTTVQPQTTNVITNSKELRILGLSGVYNQVLIDGFPMIQGLSYTYGISSIPGTLVDNIYVSKGANSVLQGYESISGQINVETKEPDKTDKLLVNVYLNNFLEKHVNANYAFKKGKWSNLLVGHMIQPAAKTDRDTDLFLDLPQLTRYMIFNKWKYGNENEKGWNSRIGLRFYNEQRVGGQVSFDSEKDRGSTSIYGQVVRTNQPEFWTKTGYRFNNKHNLVLFASGFHQSQESYFGTIRYTAQQTNVYANLQYELNYSRHELKTGASFRALNLDETISFSDTTLLRTYAGEYLRNEIIPGVFAENTLRFFEDKLTWIAGVRVDVHNQFGGMFTPRTLLKYDIAPKSIVRANIGTGWRTVNLFSENIGLLVSSRDIQITEELRPEQAVNFGVNFTQKFETESGNLSGYFSTDFYRTDFQNQIFPDYDSDPTKALIKNFTGTSISNGFQAELYVKIYKRFEVKSGYNYLDVYRIVDGEKTVLPFNPTHKVIGSFSFKPLNNSFHVDINTHWYGKQRLPNTSANPVEFQRPDYSKSYGVLNTQFTYNFKKFEVYAGCENVFDFRQKQPIISWQDPFGPHFDTSSVWGPTRGREIYFGARFRLK